MNRYNMALARKVLEGNPADFSAAIREQIEQIDLNITGAEPRIALAILTLAAAQERHTETLRLIEQAIHVAHIALTELLGTAISTIVTGLHPMVVMQEQTAGKPPVKAAPAASQAERLGELERAVERAERADRLAGEIVTQLFGPVGALSHDATASNIARMIRDAFSPDTSGKAPAPRTILRSVRFAEHIVTRFGHAGLAAAGESHDAAVEAVARMIREYATGASHEQGAL